MTRQKKFFIFGAIIFFLLLFYASYDISTRTTFPGSEPQLKERISNEYFEDDSLTNHDSLQLDSDTLAVEL